MNRRFSVSQQQRVGVTDPQMASGCEGGRLSRSATPTFQEIVATRYNRRQVLQGGIAAAVTSFFGSTLPGSAAHADVAKRTTSGRLGFSPVPVSRADTVVVPRGYRAQVLLPWGEPITGSYPAFDLGNSADEQAMQMGSHHDGMHFFPIEGKDPFEGSSSDGLLVMNHEYCEPRLMHAAAKGLALSAFDVPLNEDGSRDSEQVLKEMNAHGVSVVRIRRDADGKWSMVRDPRNRRITARTPMEIGGPLRGDDRMKTPYSPDGTRTRGTINNCSIGVTPWNTYLTCEENWWYYFERKDRDAMPASQSRYNVGRSAWRWHLADRDDDEFRRFDATARGANALEDFRNEPHCFGWVVEFDPFDPQSTPIKRTHLGRFSHEGVVFAPAIEGRPIVAYSGDDTAFEYIYKFVSARPFQAASADGSLLDEGTLYVARFHEDGSGEWLALAPGENGLTPENGFADLADILVNTRSAADFVGATKMDRPEWGAVDPTNGQVYFTLTNNTRRGEGQEDAANPRPNNSFGHIIRWSEEGTHAGTRFVWDIFVLAGDQNDSRDPNGEPLGDDAIFASPDGLWIDPDRRVWIQSDIGESDMNKGIYEVFGNNQMLVANPETGEVKRFLTGPMGQEITGVIATPDQRTLFVNVQHPGATTEAEAFAAGDLVSHWPDGGSAIPRSATLVITREDGGIIGA